MIYIKKFISFFFCILFIFSTFCFPVSAEDLDIPDIGTEIPEGFPNDVSSYSADQRLKLYFSGKHTPIYNYTVFKTCDDWFNFWLKDHGYGGGCYIYTGRKIPTTGKMGNECVFILWEDPDAKFSIQVSELSDTSDTLLFRCSSPMTFKQGAWNEPKDEDDPPSISISNTVSNKNYPLDSAGYRYNTAFNISKTNTSNNIRFPLQIASCTTNIDLLYDNTDTFNLSVSDDSDYNCNISVTTSSQDNFLASFVLANSETRDHFKYEFFDGGGSYSLSKNSPISVSFNVKDFYDKFQDNPNYSDDLIIAVTIAKYNSSSDVYEVVQLLTAEININDILSNDYSLFGEKKDFIDFPDLDDYIESFPDMPVFDSEHPLDSIWNIVKWVGECLVIVGKNLLGFFKWLGVCLGVIVQNICIALYNLVVDLRRLIIYLFVPDSKEVQYLISDKFPALLEIEKYVKAGQTSDSNTSLSLFGVNFNFSFADLPDKIKTYIYTGSTIFIYVLQLFLIVKMVLRFFRVQTPDNGGDN